MAKRASNKKTGKTGPTATGTIASVPACHQCGPGYRLCEYHFSQHQAFLLRYYEEMGRQGRLQDMLDYTLDRLTSTQGPSRQDSSGGDTKNIGSPQQST